MPKISPNTAHISDPGLIIIVVKVPDFVMGKTLVIKEPFYLPN